MADQIGEASQWQAQVPEERRGQGLEAGEGRAQVAATVAVGSASKFRVCTVRHMVEEGELASTATSNRPSRFVARLSGSRLPQ